MNKAPEAGEILHQPSQLQTILKNLSQGEDYEFMSRNGRHVMAYTESEDKAFALAEIEMQQLGLKIHTDQFGNLFGVNYPKNCDPNAPAIISGSHLDSVGTIDKKIGGGSYDGVYGVAGAIEAMRRIKEQDQSGEIKLTRPLAVVCWRAEESSLWGRAAMGASMATGSLREEDFCKYTAFDCDNNEMLLSQQIEKLRQSGKAKGYLPSCLKDLQACTAIELHIEQGPNVERGEIGIVTSRIAGSIRNVIGFLAGRAQEAFQKSVLSVRRIALERDLYNDPNDPNRDLKVLRATLNRGSEAFNVGSSKEVLDFLRVFPYCNPETIQSIKQGIQNFMVQTFPLASTYWQDDKLIILTATQFHTGTCPMDTREKQDLDALYIASVLSLYLTQNMRIVPELEGEFQTARLDLRGTDLDYMDVAHREILDIIKEIAHKAGLSLTIADKGTSEPAPLSKKISDLMENLAIKIGQKYRTLISGAGHDVMKFQNNGLIFIHSKNGLSHDSAEYSYPEDMELGANFLTKVLTELAT